MISARAGHLGGGHFTGEKRGGLQRQRLNLIKMLTNRFSTREQQMKILIRIALCIWPALLYSPTTTADTWLDYVPLNNKWAAALWSTNGVNGSFIDSISQFAITPVTSERGDVYGGNVHWGNPKNWNAPDDSIEEWGIKPSCSSRHPYIWLYAGGTMSYGVNFLVA